MAEQDQEKTEEASPFKLQEAKRRGQVWKSVEMNSMILLSAALAVIYWNGEAMIAGIVDLSRSIFSHSGKIDLQSLHPVALFEYIVMTLMDVFWPFVMVMLTMAVLANVFQTGPVFSLFPLQPDFNRLNPVQGLKRIFSIRLLFESAKSIIKLALFGLTIYFALIQAMPVLLGLMDTDPKTYVRVLLDQVHLIAFKVLAVLLGIVVVDVVFTRWDFAKRMRMSRRELKDEIKRREGDPQIRAKLRALQREAARRAGSLRRVPDADVLITNPTRLAIALKYERGKMAAPHVIAKGAGDLAAKMRQAAARSNVPIVENKPLARALFRTAELDTPVGEELFPAVARILAWIYSMRRLRNAAVAG